MSLKTVALFGCLVLASCGPDPSDDDHTVDDDSTGDDDSHGDDDTGDGLGPDGCIETAIGTSPFVEMGAEVAERVPTVIAVNWSTDNVATGSVRYGESTDDYTGEIPVVASADNAFFTLLKGLHASTDIHLRAFAEIDETLYCTEDWIVTTGPLSPSLPSLSLTAIDEGLAAGGYTIVPILTADAAIITILDSQGQYVWFWELEGYTTMRAAITMDRQSVLVSHEGFRPDSTIHKIFMDGTIEEIAAPYLGFDFVEIETGHYAFLAGEVRTFEGDRDFYGDTIVEAWEDGTTQMVWSLLDDFEPDLNETYSVEMVQYPDTEVFTHVNSLSYDPTSDSFLVTHARSDLAQLPDMIANVDRSTGDLLWTLSDTTGDFTHDEEVNLVGWPHSSRLEPDGSVLVFNRFSPIGDNCSEVTQITLDEVNGTAARTWSYAADPCLHATFLGHAERIWNDNIVAIYAASGQIDEATPDGELVWRINLDLGAGFGQGERVESLY